MTDKNYIKSFVKSFKFDNGGEKLGVSINVAELDKLPKDKYGNVSIDILQRKTPDQWGNTHYVIENTYMSNKLQSNSDDAPVEEELPF